jgi:lysylphosphatidylglycerol synthetase-like protein (DUF2156 family)
MLGSA